MDAINEKIQKAYMDTIVNEKEEASIDRYLKSLDEIDRFHEALDEKWAKKVDIKHTGEHEGKSVDQLKKEINALKGKAGNKEKMGELLFALRSKTGWKKGKGAAGL